ncbi:MAG: FKBP-type peptidyl-prolyl cis-trans isomerase [Bacteroidales bacterium]|nr:FKBP-type peptidyl-prolyl cis-trans isomerase [Bacteroidales bacterium]
MDSKKTRLNFKNLLGFILFIFLAIQTSCIKDIVDEELANEENKLIQQYIEDHEIDVTPMSSGLYYIEIEEGDSIQPVPGNYILIEFTGRYLKNEEIFATTDLNTAIANGIYSDDILYGPRKTLIDNLRYIGLIEGVSMMKEGGRAQLILPSYLAENDYVPLIYDVSLNKVIEDPEAYEDMMLEEYLLSYNGPGWDSSDNTPKRNEIIYFENNAGKGPNIIEGDSISIAYEGKLLDGRVFEFYSQDEPLNLKISRENISISGFLEGIQLMNEGASGTLIIPYDLAYGAEGKDKKIPPYSTLVYNLTILKIY